jgi:uncharacterized protein (DUF1697 family)
MPKCIALLRGINVGGNNKVEMKSLQKTFENLGFDSVVTYINSGNIIFGSSEFPKVEKIEKAIEQDFGFYVKVLVISSENLIQVCDSIPEYWLNNSEMKTDVLFLWEEFARAETLELIKTNPEVDNLIYSSGAIIWHILKKDYNQSGMNKFVGIKVYKNMTARNVNTVRKLVEILLTKNIGK